VLRGYWYLLTLKVGVILPVRDGYRFNDKSVVLIGRYASVNKHCDQQAIVLGVMAERRNYAS